MFLLSVFGRRMRDLLACHPLTRCSKTERSKRRFGCAASSWLRRTVGLLLGMIALASKVPAQQTGCGTNPFQDWYWVDLNHNPTPVVRGKLTDNTHISGAGDEDWDFFLLPDDPAVLLNNHGHANSNGLIELEISTQNSPPNIAEMFHVGSRVEAVGDWVEDGGHEDKRE